MPNFVPINLSPHGFEEYPNVVQPRDFSSVLADVSTEITIDGFSEYTLTEFESDPLMSEHEHLLIPKKIPALCRVDATKIPKTARTSAQAQPQAEFYPEGSLKQAQVQICRSSKGGAKRKAKAKTQTLLPGQTRITDVARVMKPCKTYPRHAPKKVYKLGADEGSQMDSPIANTPINRSHFPPASESDQTFTNSQPTLIPFVRSAFPSSIRRKPIIHGVSDDLLLRTCFRIGESIRAATGAERTGQNIIIELFARVTWSSRDYVKEIQYFRFVDIFSDRLPFLNGVCESWAGNKVLERDTKEFLNLETPKLCRVIGKLERQWPPRESYLGWNFSILSIWQANELDLEFTKSMYCV